MRLFISYFYQIRFFRPYQIPISTAVWDPKWFNNYIGQGHVFIDKNGVLNGIRSKSLMPGNACNGLCHGRPCDQLPDSCDFLSVYDKQISEIDKDTFFKKLEFLGAKVKRLIEFKEEPEFVLIVHEAPTNECSERIILKKHFKCEEWKRQ